MKSMFAAVIGLVGLVGSVQAQTPVAVVEDVQGKVTGAEIMDYVVPGKVIKLGAGGVIVLGYMKSCVRETITGIGTVIVGTDESMFHLADVKSDKVPCDASHSQAIDRAIGESAATVVRSLAGPNPAAPQLTLYGLSPVVQTAGRGRLVVERLDAKGERYDLDLTPASLVRGKFYDFARTHTALTPGGTYAMSLGARKIVFQVDQNAEPGAAPLISRLVRLQ